MTLYAFIGIAVTSATVVIYGTAISDPVQLLSRFHSPIAVVISLIRDLSWPHSTSTLERMSFRQRTTFPICGPGKSASELAE